MFGAQVAAQDSQSPYSMFMHLAGLKIILPSTPADAKGLLKSAIRDNNPIIFFECSRLASITGPVPDGDSTVPIGLADVKRVGRDVTVVGLAYYVLEALAVADELAAVARAARVRGAGPGPVQPAAGGTDRGLNRIGVLVEERHGLPVALRALGGRGCGGPFRAPHVG
jgi:hypothetical protein